MDEEKLNKRLKISTIAIVVLLIILLTVLIIVVAACLSSQNSENNNDSNMGLVAQSDDSVFYYKYNDGLIKATGKEEVKLTSDQSCSIKYLDGYVYYSVPNITGGIDIKKIKEDGTDLQVLLSTTSKSTKTYLKDGFLYYTTTNPATISKMDINGQNSKVLLNRNVDDFKIEGEKIYFSDSMKFLYSVDLNGENYEIVVKEPNFDRFQILDEEVYYFDNASGSLIKVNLKDTENREVVTDKLNCNIYNVTSEGIYYFDKESSKIWHISANGKKTKEITTVNSDNTKINIAGTSLYYIDMNEKGQAITKRVATNGKVAEEVKY